MNSPMSVTAPLRPIHRLLVANRGEIAIRVFRAATELGIATIAIYSHEDRFALHRFKADESYLVGAGKGPVQAYLDIADILRIAREAHVDAIHPGYGFNAENPAFAEACAEAGIIFIGPSPDVMRRLGGKVEAREIARSVGVPTLPATGALPADAEGVIAAAAAIGFPVMLKASWGGGGRGMRAIEDPAELVRSVEAGRSEALAAFGNGEVYLEKFLRRAQHIEVQILGDAHGNVVHVFERDCSIQRRNQKVVEQAPAPFITPELRAGLCAAAVTLVRSVNYASAGTVEFLVDAEAGAFYFIEVNPRIQVEHTVTEVVSGIDLIKAQIRIAEGARIGTPESGVPPQEEISTEGFAMQCRVTTENPERGFTPDYGAITAYRPAAGFGIRLDGATAYSGAVITPYYDSLLEKVTAWAPTREEARMRMLRALREFRVRGVSTNLSYLEALLSHPRFCSGDYSTRFIDETPELTQFVPSRDRATRLLSFLSEVLVNGNPEVAGRPRVESVPVPRVPPAHNPAPADGTKQLLDRLGPEGFTAWMRAQERTLVTDTTFRDAHQSLLATRFRTQDMTAIAPVYARDLPNLFSLECWGGATFDVAMRFLKEDPWGRLVSLREAVPNILLQMLLRGANAVGYKNYPDNAVRYFIAQAAGAGVDLFRVFDSLNWVENMRVSIDAIRESGKLCEAAICYSGDIDDPKRPKYNLRYYIELAKQLEKAGAHILGIKDMAGVCRPYAARQLVAALREEIGIPIHFHTHDTSGNAGASVLAAVEAGCDAVDGALDAMSGFTSQPNLGSLVAALEHTPRSTQLNREALMRISTYWGEVRKQYAAFESEMRSGSSDVYVHEMPGGQYTNLQEQAKALGIADRWPEVVTTYHDVSMLFGDIVKVTPTSKVVGDMSLYMLTSGISAADVLDPRKDVSFPASVVELFAGELGQTPGGFPAALQRKVLRGRAPLEGRPGETLPPANLEAERAAVEKAIERKASERDLASYLMYPDVFVTFAKHASAYGDVSSLPTDVFFYGMTPGQEISLEIERGKTLIVRYIAMSEPDGEGRRKVFFEMNGQPRTVSVDDRRLGDQRVVRRKADPADPSQVGAPMPGLVVRLSVEEGQAVEAGTALLTIEAMKMQTVLYAERRGVVRSILATPGTHIEAQDLLLVVQS
jgi:pyruvate carboxylase